MTKEDNSISFGLGLLGGIVGGIIAGILLAPKSGEETRKEIQEAVSNVAEKYTPEVIEAKKQALTTIEMVSLKMENFYNKINSSIKNRQMAKAKIIENGEDELN